MKSGFNKNKEPKTLLYLKLLYNVEPMCLGLRAKCLAGGQATPRNHQVWWFDREQRGEGGSFGLH